MIIFKACSLIAESAANVRFLFYIFKGLFGAPGLYIDYYWSIYYIMEMHELYNHTMT